MLRRYAPLRRYVRMRVRAIKPKRGRIQDEAFLAFVRAQPCLVHSPECKWRVEAHHIGRPRDDRRVVPLCAWHHREGPDAVHVLGAREFERKFNVDFRAAIRSLNVAWETKEAARKGAASDMRDSTDGTTGGAATCGGR